MELDPIYAIPGFIVASILIILFCNPFNKGFGTLQRGEKLVKQNYGPRSSCCFKWCTILVLMPLYFITVWMAFVALGGNVGMSIIDQVCDAASTSCRDFFSLGLTRHNNDVCTDYTECGCPPGRDNCNVTDMYARSGSSHLDFAPTLGLGQDLTPVYRAVNYTDSSSPTACVAGSCSVWLFNVQDAVAFNIGECECLSGSPPASCDKWECDELVMPYFYPNVIFCLLVAFLYLLPVMWNMADNIKLQMQKKCFPCGDIVVLKFSQAGGLETTSGGVLAAGMTGGHAQNINRDKEMQVKLRSFSRFDCALYVFGTLIIILCTYFMWVAAGFLSIVMLLAVVVIIIIRHLVRWLFFCREQKARTAARAAS